MKKISPFLFSLVVICSIELFAQEKTDHIFNTKTSAHVTLPGYNMYLKIPEGYSPALHFTGWLNKNGSLIILGKKQKTLVETLTEIEERLSAEGYLSIKKKLMVNDFPAVLIETEGNKSSQVKKNILVLNKDGICYLIEFKSQGGKEEINTLKKSVLSIFPE